MTQYSEFARAYAEGDYTSHSKEMAKLMPEIIRDYGVSTQRILDIACGEGTFARMMAEQGYNVKGIDLSEDMIRIADMRKKDESLEFEIEDIRDFSEEGYGLVTCWYDSLNYIKSKSELKSVFRNVKDALEDDGYFIFDMNTYSWLAEGWPSTSCYISRDDDEMFEVHRTKFNEETRLFTLKVTGFKKDEHRWTKFEEEHEEKAYRVEEIKSALKETGFEILDIYGDLESRSKLLEDDQRAWFITKLKH